MTDYTIKHIENESRFIIINDANKEMGKLFYLLDGQDTLIIDSVVVNPAYGGKGLGSKLVTEALKYVKEKNYSVKSTCSFANKFL